MKGDQSKTIDTQIKKKNRVFLVHSGIETDVVLAKGFEEAIDKAVETWYRKAEQEESDLLAQPHIGQLGLVREILVKNEKALDPKAKHQKNRYFSCDIIAEKLVKKGIFVKHEITRNRIEK